MLIRKLNLFSISLLTPLNTAGDDMFSKKISSIPTSVTFEILTAAKKLEAQGKKIYHFSAGEPDFPLDSRIKAAGIKAMDDNFVKYTSVSGIPELKQEIIKKLKRDNQLQYAEEEIIVTAGAKQALFNAILAICNPGDEAIIPKPYWVSYLQQVKLADAVPIIAETENFQVKASLIEKKISKKTKAIIINSPCNPTGIVIPKKELEQIATLAVKHNIIVISDEIYEKIIYEGKHHSIASLGKEIRENTITVNGVSKSNGLTGLRLGYAAAPREIIKLMNIIQNHTTSNASSIVQKMAAAALRISDNKELIDVLQQKRDFIQERLREMNISFVQPQGAFYFFIEIPRTITTGKQSKEFCQQLLEQEGVACVPGIAFGQEGYFRLSYTCSKEDISAGLQAIDRFIKRQKMLKRKE